MSPKAKPKKRHAASWVRPDGHRVFFYSYRSRRDAQEQKAVYQADWREGRIADSPAARETVRGHMAWWLENVASVKLRASSLDQYQRLTKGHIEPALGDVRLTELGQPQVQEFVTGLTKKLGLKPATVAAIHKVLHGALVSVGPRPKGSGLLPWNPADGIVLPKIKKTQGKSLTVDELGRFLEACKEHPLGDLFLVQVTCGLRPMETPGLRWADVRWETAEIEVAAQLTYSKAQGWEPSDLKTEASAAVVPMMGITEQALRRQQDRQRFTPSDLVFTVPNGKPVNRSALQRAWWEITALARITGRAPHSLRWTYATALAREHVHSRIQMALMRHSRVEQTMDYTEPEASQQRDAVDRLSKSFGG